MTFVEYNYDPYVKKGASIRQAEILTQIHLDTNRFVMQKHKLKH